MRLVKDIIERKDLLYQLTKADLAVQYKGKALGVLWAILDPIFLMLTYYVLITVIFHRGGNNYAALLFIAVLSWRWFLQSALGSTKLITSNANLLQTVRFPIATLVLSRVLVQTLNFVLGLLVLMPMLIYLHIMPTLKFAWLPVLIVVQFIFNLSVGLAFAVIGVYFRDLYNLMSFGLRLVFYLSPGLFALTDYPVHLQKWILMLNPFASIFEGFKGVLIYGTTPSIFLITPVFIAVLIIASLNNVLVKPNRLIKDL